MAPTPIQRRVCPGLAYPYSPMLPSVLAVVNVEGAHTGTTQTLFEVILLPQRSPRSYIAVISSPLILNTSGDVHTPPLKCPLQGRREHVSPNFSRARETCLRLPQIFLFNRNVKTQAPQLATRLTGEGHPYFFLISACWSCRG